VSNQISWLVVLAIKPGQMHHFLALTREMVESTRQELGVLIYERFVTDDEQFVHLYERYANSAAAVTHLNEFHRTYGERFASLVDRRTFTVYGSPSAELKALLDGFGATYLKHLGDLSYWP
jgi:quinol monooxygenase YgiN